MFGATCVTSLYSLVLPGIVSTGVKWYILKRTTGKGTNVLSSMLYNQVTLTVVMVAVGLAGSDRGQPGESRLAGNAADVDSPAPVRRLPRHSPAVSMLALNDRTGGPVIRLLMAALRPLPRRSRRRAGPCWSRSRCSRSAGWRFHLTIAVINVVDGLLVGLLWYLFCRPGGLRRGPGRAS